jgi:hypothetical protein
MADQQAPPPPDYEAEFRAAFEVSDLGVGRFYFNGFGMLAGPADVSLLFKQGDQAVALAAASYPVMKELAIKLLDTVRQVEHVLGAEFPTIEEAGQKMVDYSMQQQPPKVK